MSTTAQVECGAAPRSVDEIIALAESLPEDEQIWTPFPPGAPADPATTAAITAVVHELEACINTGDFLRVLGLFSADGAMFRGLPMTDEVETELRTMAASTPTPAPEGERQVLIGPWAVRVLDDGRVTAAVLFTYENERPFAEAAKALFFVHRDGRWWIDEWTESVVMPGCELPVQVEHAVEPPPGITVEPWPSGCDAGEEAAKKRKKRRDTPAAAANEEEHASLLLGFFGEDRLNPALDFGKDRLDHVPDNIEIDSYGIVNEHVPHGRHAAPSDFRMATADIGGKLFGCLTHDLQLPDHAVLPKPIREGSVLPDGRIFFDPRDRFEYMP